MVIFVLLGYTHSYKNYVKERCSHNHTINCCTTWEIEFGKINVVTGGIQDYRKLLDEYGTDSVHPVYIHTSGDIVLRDGLSSVQKGVGTCHNLCATFLQESKDYSEESLNSIGAYVIDKGSAADTYYAFMEYMKKVLSNNESK